ncbi:hypothetical protein CLAFUW4_10862 [Fulvia fulva]|nr:hypothetical protein CLAFUR4_10867 [Fulvia fulva]KAK4620342.1 hypothetical protein CLAFUR0_10874 [Fulvia fulva]WPV16832.1 hypothetical protein CLAFUW4_10862 [Fulvia fulva]WPV32255.1 hypothetical protein CLAFUW7_10860 [Fulvia fulva]
MPATANGTTNGHVDEDLATAFRKHLPDLTSPRFTTSKEQTPYEYSEAFQKTHHPPWLYNLTETWKELLKEPYKGVTNDGTVRPNLYKNEDLGVNTAQITAAVNTTLSLLTPSQATQLRYPLASKEWRCWSNPEFLLRPFGLRLEGLSDELAQSILSILSATFPPEGYAKALAAMRINHFLGDLCSVPQLMNQYSYNFLLFGSPSSTEAWGWSLYGHHLCLSVFLKGGDIIISPTFTGAEPNLIDAGPWKGTAILHKEGELGLKLMQSLSQGEQKTAQIFKLMRDPGMLQSGDLKVDRWNQDDQRHLCGAFRDNRVVPYEGVKVSTMTSEQQDLVLEIAEEFLLYHPHKARQRRKEQIKEHFEETYFSWIGGYGDDDAFYYRVQSPVIIFEFDHHSGVFLTNTEPAKYHTHTIVRMPNQGDYGQAWRKPEERVP